MIRICLFSEDRTLQSLLSSAFGAKFNVSIATNIPTIEGMVRAGQCEVILIDLDSNHPSIELMVADAQRLIANHSATVVMADDSLRPTAVELVRKGASGYCRRPPSIQELTTQILRAHETVLLRRLHEPEQHRFAPVNECDRLIGSSPQMQQVYDLVRRVADINASVLITGESGTGKELIANAIHNLGSRSAHPFVAVSCGAIPETLIEAELFGHEKGAFTGTVGARAGYLEQAGEGTLFLDEIGEVSLSTQVKLLRVLQQREYNRLGSSRVLPLRARVIFATNRDLNHMVAQGTFRQDLYYRINIMRIDAPSLQDHPEDILQIATHFLQSYSGMYRKQIVRFDQYAIAALQSYSWPGNVRELENIIQRANILASDTMLHLEDLPTEIQEHHVLNIQDDVPAGSFERQLRDYKLKLALNAIRDQNGNKTLAARHLNISRAYLHRLIRISERDIMDTGDGTIAQDQPMMGAA